MVSAPYSHSANPRHPERRVVVFDDDVLSTTAGGASSAAADAGAQLSAVASA
jgi:hypothetical protein